MLKRDEWLDAARKLDWEFSYVSERDVYPEALSGKPWLPHAAWEAWDEPFRLSYTEYVTGQAKKEAGLAAVRDALGGARDFRELPVQWLSALKLHSAVLALPEFAAVVGNLRAGRFARDSAWRNTALFGALDELRHTQLQLQLGHELVRLDPQFDWTHKFLHTNNWVAIAARHMVDELLLVPDPIELAVGCNAVFETGFTNLEFAGMAAVAYDVGDRMFERLLASIQSDEARHAQIGEAVLKVLVEHDRERAQYLLDKWFWRSWRFFAIVTGFSMDYFTPLERRERSFREFIEEWIIEQYARKLAPLGLSLPWYWPIFLESLGQYHHMVYLSAYSYRSTVWFDFVLPGPAERTWLRQKYPDSWPAFDACWDQVTTRWRNADPGNDLSVHSSAIVGFCDLCQLTLSGGTPMKNTAQSIDRDGKRYIFCSEPCRWIFEQEPERYSAHRNVVQRVLTGEAPANLVALLRWFGLTATSWGADAHEGRYPWLTRTPKR